MKLSSTFTLAKAYKKGFGQGSKFWKAGFVFLLIGKLLKYFISKPQPQTFEQYELEPGEYRIVVTENKK